MYTTTGTTEMTHRVTRAVMLDAWAISHRAAKRFGHSAKDFIAAALKQAWARWKASQVTQQHPQRKPKVVYTVCIDEALPGRRMKLLNQLAVEAYYTDIDAARAVRALLAGAFRRPFIKASRGREA